MAIKDAQEESGETSVGFKFCPRYHKIFINKSSLKLESIDSHEGKDEDSCLSSEETKLSPEDEQGKEKGDAQGEEHQSQTSTCFIRPAETQVTFNFFFFILKILGVIAILAFALFLFLEGKPSYRAMRSVDAIATCVLYVPVKEPPIVINLDLKTATLNSSILCPANERNFEISTCFKNTSLMKVAFQKGKTGNLYIEHGRGNGQRVKVNLINADCTRPVEDKSGAITEEPVKNRIFGGQNDHMSAVEGGSEPERQKLHNSQNIQTGKLHNNNNQPVYSDSCVVYINVEKPPIVINLDMKTAALNLSINCPVHEEHFEISTCFKNTSVLEITFQKGNSGNLYIEHGPGNGKRKRVDMINAECSMPVADLNKTITKESEETKNAGGHKDDGGVNLMSGSGVFVLLIFPLGCFICVLRKIRILQRQGNYLKLRPCPT